MKAFLGKMAAAVTMGQQQPPTTQTSAAPVQVKAPRSQPALSAQHHEAAPTNSTAMPQPLLPHLREVLMLTPVMVTRDDFD
jgi:hypothetical protein